MKLRNLAFPLPSMPPLAGPSNRPLTAVEQYRQKWERNASRDMAQAIIAGEDVDVAAERISRRWHRAVGAEQLLRGGVWLALRLAEKQAKHERYAHRRAQVRAVLYGEPAVSFAAGIGLGMPDPDESLRTPPPFRWINHG